MFEFILCCLALTDLIARIYIIRVCWFCISKIRENTLTVAKQKYLPSKWCVFLEHFAKGFPSHSPCARVRVYRLLSITVLHHQMPEREKQRETQQIARGWFTVKKTNNHCCGGVHHHPQRPQRTSLKHYSFFEKARWCYVNWFAYHFTWKLILIKLPSNGRDIMDMAYAWKSIQGKGSFSGKGHSVRRKTINTVH